MDESRRATEITPCLPFPLGHSICRHLEAAKVYLCTLVPSLDKPFPPFPRLTSILLISHLQTSCAVHCHSFVHLPQPSLPSLSLLKFATLATARVFLTACINLLLLLYSSAPAPVSLLRTLLHGPGLLRVIIIITINRGTSHRLATRAASLLALVLLLVPLCLLVASGATSFRVVVVLPLPR